MAEKYTVSNIPIETLLGYIKSGEIAIPEIQRPFVWKPRQVRDLIDSLYTGYPIGYLLKRVNLAKSKDELFSVHELIKTLRNMDMTFIGGEGYLPAYTRTELTNRLHGSSGFRTDYQITTKRMMNTIIAQTKSTKAEKKPSYCHEYRENGEVPESPSQLSETSV